jgi:hypothetical protein
MCIACEMAWMMALDELPDEPPPGFPRPRREERFACDAPEQPAPPTREGERKP